MRAAASPSRWSTCRARSSSRDAPPQYRRAPTIVLVRDRVAPTARSRTRTEGGAAMTAAMNARPGTSLARRPLHFIVVADCSGSMASDGKMQALNTALRETIPHLVDVAAQNPHADVLL